MTQDGLRLALERYFGFSEFRLGQEQLIRSLLVHGSVLGVMPTGSGKSLCYQLPATILEGVTLVVSPLIALMKDQVDQLVGRGVAATFINSSVPAGERASRMTAIRAGSTKLIYVAPERLQSGFLQQLEGVPVAAFIVDEAHCISQWGHDFRPDYRGLGDVARSLGVRRVGAFTATATAEVRSDIRAQLGIPEHASWVFGFERPNLRFDVVHVRRPAEKAAHIVRYLRRNPGQSGIVYAATRRSVEAFSAQLTESGFAAAAYHAGLEEATRASVQDGFMAGRHRVIVATNAFGMGIDKQDLRFVIHYELPGSLEALYQEAGRAGRDGHDADTTLLFADADVRIHEFLNAQRRFSEGTPWETENRVRELDQRRLEAVVRYAREETCHHAQILEYFGERFDRVPCARCDVCDGAAALTSDRRQTGSGRRSSSGPPPARLPSDAEAVVIQKVLSAVARAAGDLPARVLAQAVCGSKSETALSSKLAGTPSYGVLPGYLPTTIDRLLHALSDAGCVESVASGTTRYQLTELGRDVMWRRRAVALSMRPFGGDEDAPSSSAISADPHLLLSLRAARATLASTLGVPATALCSDTVLKRLAAERPDYRAFMTLPGIALRRPELLWSCFGPLLSK